MLGRDHRLTSGRDFVRTIRTGRRAGTGTLVAHLGLDDSQLPPRLGLVVGKSVGIAVVRNRVKRRLRHVARAHLVALPPGAVLVIRALPPAAEASSTELDRDVVRVVGRLLARTAA